MLRETLVNLIRKYSLRELVTKIADEYLWSILKHIPGPEGIFLRNVYMSIFCLEKDGFVFIQRNVHVSNSCGLIFGKNVYINRGCYIGAYGGITFGENSALGPNVVLVTIDHGFMMKGTNYIGRKWVKKPISIGEYAMICANCCINPGVTIGNNVIVAAGSAISCDIPDNARVSTSKLDSYAESVRHDLNFVKGLHE